MVNRTIQQKTDKKNRRGKSRRWGKKSSMGSPQYINSTVSSPNKEGMAILQAATGNTLHRNRAGSIFVNRSLHPDTIAFWEARYPSMKYSKREIKERGLPDEYGIIKNNPVPRGEALRRADELLKETDITMHYREKKGYSYNLDIFFNAKKTKWFVLETDLDRGRIRKSGIYPSREVIKALLPNNINWVDTILIPSEDSS